MSDPIEDLTAGLALRSSLYFRAEFTAPFAISVPADRRRIRFHIAGPGDSWIRLPSGVATHYREGDLILVPHGSAHILSSGPTEAAQPLGTIAAGSEAGTLRHGGGGSPVELVCGHFEFDETVVNPLVDSLPAIIHVKADPTNPEDGGGTSFDWMPPLLRAVEREPTSGDAVARRLSEILFIQVLRVAATQGSVATGLLGLIADPQLGRAVRAIHADPAANWSLESLASVAGASRSAFADRFRQCAGTTPMRYLADWRIRRAQRLLGDPGLSVGDVSRRVGYASEAAFSRAYRTAVGEAPGRHRRSLLSDSA